MVPKHGFTIGPAFNELGYAAGSTRMSDVEDLGSPDDDDASAFATMMDFVGSPSRAVPQECKTVMVRWGSFVRYTCV